MTGFTDQVKLHCDDVITFSPPDIVKRIWWFVDGHWFPYNGGLIHGTSYLTVSKDPDTYGADLFEILAEGVTEDDPLLATNRGLVVQKDIACGGYISANQGALWLGSGLDDQVDVPRIILTQATTSRLGGGGPFSVQAVPSGMSWPTAIKGTVAVRTDSWNGNPANTLYKHNGTTWIPMGPTSYYAGNFDTLYLTKFANGTTNEPAHLNLGNLFLQEGFIEWTNGEHDSVGSFYPTDIVYTPYCGSAATNKLEFFISNGQYSAGTKAGRQNLAMTLRGDGVVVAKAGYLCIQGSSTKSLNLWDSNEDTVAYFAHDGSNAYINANGTLFLNGSSGLVAPPSTHNVWCGQASTSGYAWAGVAGNYIYSHSSYTGHYDEYDDLSYVKSYKIKKAMINDPVTNEKIERTVIDVPASFPFLVNEHGFMHVGDTFGYTVGCLKQVALKLDEHDTNFAEVANLKNEVASLKAQVEALAKAAA
jgi:hypothetical protein